MRFIEIMTERDINQTVARLKALITHPNTPENERNNAKAALARMTGRKWQDPRDAEPKQEPKKQHQARAPHMSDEEMKRKARAQAHARAFKAQQRANAAQADKARRFGKEDLPDFGRDPKAKRGSIHDIKV